MTHDPSNTSDQIYGIGVRIGHHRKRESWDFLQERAKANPTDQKEGRIEYTMSGSEEERRRLVQGTRFHATSVRSGVYLQVMDEDVSGHPSMALLRLTSGPYFGANSTTSRRLCWLFDYFDRFKKGNNHTYDVNCMYWEDVGVDSQGAPLPSMCLVLGPFRRENEDELPPVKDELDKLRLLQKTHLAFVDN